MTRRPPHDHCGERCTATHSYDCILASMYACVEEVLGVDAARLRPDITLLELGATSFDFVTIVIRLEEMYGISLGTDLSIPNGLSIATAARTLVGEVTVSH
jgi:acyl carrier protein